MIKKTEITGSKANIKSYANFDFNTYLENLQDYAVILLDTEGSIIYWNLGAIKISGYNPEEVCGKYYRVLFSVEDEKKGIPGELLRKAKKNGRSEYSGLYKNRNGTRLILNCVITAVLDFKNELTGFTVISRVITNAENNSDQLIQSERKFKNLIESAPDAMVIVNGKGIITLVNIQTEKLFGYSKEELEGQRVEILMPRKFVGSHIKLREEFSENPKTRYMGEGRQLTGKRKDGSEFNIEIALSPIKVEHGEDLLVAAAIRDITARIKIENEIRELNRTLEERVKDRTEELERSLNEKVTMLQEIHHRVKNNLQTVSSLLRIQSDKIPGSPAIEYLRASERRIRSMALIHMQLYKTKDFSRINIRNYTHELCKQLLISFGISNNRINLQIEIEDIFFAIDTALPCGLIINELFTNSLKHAFPDNREGNILIKIKKNSEGSYQLVYRDDGIGAPGNFITEDPSKLGILLIHTLNDQLEGEITVDVTDGTEFSMKFSDTVHKTHYRT
ncbi:MAG: PAS domain S-box protein [Ignavibacteria bacterium]|nr:PAS domain S-box protein [Ignavibacteria bacterium]